MPFLHLRDCVECGAEYETADKWEPFCPKCMRRQQAMQANDIRPRFTGYGADRNRRGASREAMKILKGDE